jgi:hypothetical protein
LRAVGVGAGGRWYCEPILQEEQKKGAKTALFQSRVISRHSPQAPRE